MVAEPFLVYHIPGYPGIFLGSGCAVQARYWGHVQYDRIHGYKYAATYPGISRDISIKDIPGYPTVSQCSSPSDPCAAASRARAEARALGRRRRAARRPARRWRASRSRRCSRARRSLSPTRALARQPHRRRVPVRPRAAQRPIFAGRGGLVRAGLVAVAVAVAVPLDRSCGARAAGRRGRDRSAGTRGCRPSASEGGRPGARLFGAAGSASGALARPRRPPFLPSEPHEGCGRGAILPVGGRKGSLGMRGDRGGGALGQVRARGAGTNWSTRRGGAHRSEGAQRPTTLQAWR
jgi:hypothetical protein